LFSRAILVRFISKVSTVFSASNQLVSSLFHLSFHRNLKLKIMSSFDVFVLKRGNFVFCADFIYSFIGDRLPLPITPFRPDVTDPAKNTSQGNISVNESLVNSTTIQEQSSLCGFPSFCSGEAQRRCLNTTLINCDQCNLGIAVIFGVFVGALGLSIIVLNSLTLCYCFFKEKQTYYDHMKASLAVADILTGNRKFAVGNSSSDNKII